MYARRELDDYRRFVESTLVSLGRDDIGVGEVTVPNEGVLSVTFSRGSHSHTAEIPLEQLDDRERAKAAVNRAIATLSKSVERESMARAERLVQE
jgi:hypothetical protein